MNMQGFPSDLNFEGSQVLYKNPIKSDGKKLSHLLTLEERVSASTNNMGSSNNGEDLNTRLIQRRGKEGEEEEEKWSVKLRVENRKLWRVAGPAMLINCSNFGVGVVTQAFIGHIGSTELAGYSIVYTVILRFANGILLGMASALETLCGQSYGAKQYHMLGIYLQRSWLILSVCALLLLPIFIFTTPILLFFHQEEHIAEMAGVISIWFIPIVISYVFTFTLQMFLQSQSRNVIVMYVSAVTFVFHLALSWLLIVKLDLGIPGAMGSMILSQWIPVFGQLAYVIYGGCPDTWIGLSWTAFTDLGRMVKLSVSSGVMLCLELWYNTILVFLTGYMKNAEIALDALSICLNISGWEMMISLGFLISAGVRVSNELGAGSSKNAKFSVLNIVAQSTIIGITFFIFFIFLRGSITYIFTDSSDVAAAVSTLSPLLAVSILLNSVQPVLSGVAVGSGWQGVVAYVNLGCYYIIGIPLGVVLAYVIKLSVIGMWSGMIIGTLCQTLILTYMTLKTDWEKQVTGARERLSNWYVGDTSQGNGSDAHHQPA